MPLQSVTPILRPSPAGFYANPANMQVDATGDIMAVSSGTGGAAVRDGTASGGIDFILIMGQSNTLYGGTGSVVDNTNPAVLMMGTDELSGGAYTSLLQQIVQGANPTITGDVNGGGTTPIEGYSWAIPFANLYATNVLLPGRFVCVIHCGIGGTTLQQWMPTTNPYFITNTVSQGSGITGNLTNRAVAYANYGLSLSNTNVLKAICWLQGESNAYALQTILTNPLEYVNGLSVVIDYVRNTVSGASSCPFICGMMQSNWVAAQDTYTITGGIPQTGNSNISPQGPSGNIARMLNNLFLTINQYIDYSAVANNADVMTLIGPSNTNIHYDTLGDVQLYGTAFYAGYLNALQSRAVTPVHVRTPPMPFVLSPSNNNSATPGLTWTPSFGAYYYIITRADVPSVYHIQLGLNYIFNSGPVDSSTNPIAYMQGPSFLAFTSGSNTFYVTAVNRFGTYQSNTVSLTYLFPPPGAFTGSITSHVLSISTPSPAATSFSITVNSITVTGLTIFSFPYTINNSTFSLTPSTVYNCFVTAINGGGSTNCTNYPISFTSAASSFTAFLTTFPGATAAYGMRQLNSLATGAFQISVSGTPTVVGFNSNGTLNLTGLSGTYPLLQWYDQSGNGNYLSVPGVNATINFSVSGSSITYNNPGVVFTNDGTTVKNLIASSALTVPTASTVLFVVQQSGGFYLLGNNNVNSNCISMNSTMRVSTDASDYMNSNAVPASLSSSQTLGFISTGTATTSTMVSHTSTTTPFTAFAPGTGEFAGANVPLLGTSQLGSSPGNDLIGVYHEIIIYPTAKSVGTVQSMQTNQQTFYAIP